MLNLLRLLEALHHVAEHVATEHASKQALHVLGKWILLVLRSLLLMLHVWIHHLHTGKALGGHHARLRWSLRLRLELLLLMSSLLCLKLLSLLLSSEFFEALFDFLKIIGVNLCCVSLFDLLED